jgi:type IV pilus assembly protein PilM
MPLPVFLQRLISEPPPDFLFEVTERSLACVAPRSPEAQRREVFPELGLTASPSAPNILRSGLFRDALPKVVTGNQKNKSAAVIIPDYAARMAIIDFEEFPAKPDDQIKLLKFRLRKSVPFPIDEAQLAYSVQFREARRIEILAVAIAKPILSEYESIFVDAGYRLGLVQPSSLAALRLCDRGEAGLTLLVKAAGPTLSVILLDEGRVRMIRSLDLSGEENEWQQPGSDSVMLLLQQTFAYCEDQIGKPAQRLILCGFGPENDSLAEEAEREFSVSAFSARSKFGIASQENAGLLGLLEQYAA